MLSLSLIRLSDGRPVGLAWYDVQSWAEGLREALDEFGVTLGPVGRKLPWDLAKLAPLRCETDADEHAGPVAHCRASFSPFAVNLCERCRVKDAACGYPWREELTCASWMRQAARLLSDWGLTLTPLTPELEAAYNETDPGVF